MKGKYTTDPCARTDTRLYSRSLVTESCVGIAEHLGHVFVRHVQGRHPLAARSFAAPPPHW